ncbi:hypothetical protein AB0D46_12910 [Streptomyces sp. NPDC048383]|uniref:hypothetical protein n=1 Tax=Streptomyces sp. NPDC048383 TaxID=3155386 RepID=UPI003437A597
MRPSRDRETTPAASHTPIYDTLYSEYRRSFRALPGDRSGEEHLGFTAFSQSASYSSYGTGGWNSSTWPSDPWQPVHAPLPVPATPSPQASYAHAGTTGSGYGGGRQHQTGMQHIPAALPPAPRRGY